MGPRTARGWSFQGAVTLLVAGLSIATVGSCARRPADGPELKRQLATIRSSVTGAIVVFQKKETGAISAASSRSELERRRRELESTAARLRSARPEPSLEPS
jgi:hypothetical protein